MCQACTARTSPVGCTRETAAGLLIGALLAAYAGWSVLGRAPAEDTRLIQGPGIPSGHGVTDAASSTPATTPLPAPVAVAPRPLRRQPRQQPQIHLEPLPPRQPRAPNRAASWMLPAQPLRRRPRPSPLKHRCEDSQICQPISAPAYPR